MALFDLPAIEDSSVRRFSSLGLEATIELNRVQKAALRKQLSFEGESHHLFIRQAVTLNSRSAEIFGLLGIHAARGTPKKASKRSSGGSFLHYQIELRSTSRSRSSSTDDRRSWQDAWQIVTPIIATHPAAVTLKLTVPSSEPLAISLPIFLAGDTPGFSEIWGVRLVQPDPANPSNELYSVILDKYRKGFFITATTVFETSYSNLMLRSAFNHAAGIAHLAANGE